MPNIKGEFERVPSATPPFFNGAFEIAGNDLSLGGDSRAVNARRCSFDASRSNQIYGASDTVQPPALTLLPCIKVFDAASNPGLTTLPDWRMKWMENWTRSSTANRSGMSSMPYSDGTNWYRKWSDGWLEQGGVINTAPANEIVTLTFLKPYSSKAYSILKNIGGNTSAYQFDGYSSFYSLTTTSAKTNNVKIFIDTRWYACGQGA